MSAGARSEAFGADDFEELFDATFSDVWRFVRRRLMNADDADDVTAEVYTVIWRRRDALPPSEERRLWLFGVARNVLANHHRGAVRQQRLTARISELGETTRPVELPEPRDPAVWVALARLEIHERELLIMRAWDQLSVSDMAVLLDTTPNAVSVRLSRARNRLRDELDANSATGPLDATRPKDRVLNGDGSVDPEPERSNP